MCLIVPEYNGIEFGTYIGNEYDRDVWNLHWTLLIIGLVQAVVSIVAAGYSCSAICCGQNQNNPGVVIYAPACNTNQSNLTQIALNVQATTPGNFVYASNPITSTNSIFVDVPLNTQKQLKMRRTIKKVCILIINVYILNNGLIYISTIYIYYDL